MPLAFRSEQSSQQRKPNGRARSLKRRLQELFFLANARLCLQEMADRSSTGRSPARSNEYEVERLTSEQCRDEDRELEYLRRKYEALLEGAPDAVFIADAQSGTIIEANEAAASLLETTVDAIAGRHQSELHPSEDTERYSSFFRSHQQAAREKGGATFNKLDDGSQICVVTDNGSKIPVEINASFVDLNGEELFVGIFRDISERLRREEALREAKKMAEHASELKSSILRNMSHEVRTPITSIIGFSKILSDSLDGVPEEHADKIHQASQRLMKTIDSVIELSKLEVDVHDLEREIARLDQAARWAVELLDCRTERKGLELRTSIPDQPIAGYWNQEALNQIVEHLLENAVRFTPAEGTIELRVFRTENQAVLEIEDSGIGMDPDEVDRLFKPFKQASEGLTRNHSGVGLGLPIVRQLAEALGGTVEVETETGEGSCFMVRLPLGEERAETLPAE